MLRVIAWFELVASLPCLAVLPWSFSSYCSGRPLGMDCESWAIFGFNLYAPIGLLALVCSLWTLWANSRAPQVVLASGCAAVLLYWLWHML